MPRGSRSLRRSTVLAALALAFRCCSRASPAPPRRTASVLARAARCPTGPWSGAPSKQIWGMPAVNYDLMLQQMLGKTGGKVNEVIYWGRPLDWKNQTLTPNPDALYFMAFFNTKDGPIVLDLPPGDNNGSFNGNIVTAWQVPLEDAGLLGYDRQGRQIPCSAAGLCGQGAGRLHPAAVRHIRRLHAVSLRSRQPQRRRCPQDPSHTASSLSLSACAGGQPARYRLHRCEGRRFRLHDPLRRELLRAP